MKPGTTRHGQSKSVAANKVGARCHVEVSRVGTAAYLTLAGELDLSCVKRFGDMLQRTVDGDVDDLVIDLRSVTFIDSTGLVLLLKADALAREEGFHLHIVRSPIEIVRAVFEVSGIDTLLPLSDEPPQLIG